jgi:dolichol-phosphate mannosyltransferase
MIAVIVPCYRCKNEIMSVISRIGPEVSRIYVVDDACPDGSGRWVQQQCRDPRATVLFHDANQGVGGAVITGYQRALQEGASILVKLDGDGQMDPALIPALTKPIGLGLADYAKGNRFFFLGSLSQMPTVRLVGNAVLSFLNKLIHGYWNIMDPTNGFTAAHASSIKLIPLDRLSRRYFFESDMLFRLSTVRAVVVDVPMDARYAKQKSSLSIGRVLFEFPPKYANRFVKRLCYNYFLRDFNAGSVELLLGVILLAIGVGFGAWHWYLSAKTGVVASSGTVMLASLPIILGTQALLSFIQFDTLSTPTKPIQLLQAEGKP